MNMKPLGQEPAWQSLLKFGTEAIPQATLLLGPAGVGKKRATLAYYQWIHCENRLEDAGCGSCSSCMKIVAGNHPDYMLLEPQGDAIPVESVREMKKTLYYPPMAGRVRFVVIDNAHKLNAASANTLLKTLEEPPAHTRFFLITHEKALLLPTILSRCQFIYFNPLTEDVLKEVLAFQEIQLPARLAGLCVDLLCGGVEHAALLSDEKTIEFLSSLTTLKLNNAQIAAFADTLAAEEWKLKLFLNYLSVEFKNRALKASTPDQVYEHSQLGLDAAFLNRRLERHANKKLIALAASQLGQRI